MHCPNCKSKNLGKIGTNQFYCWDCFIELSLIQGRLSLSQVEEDGSLTTLDDLFDESELRVENA
ncbi:hypothetical protein [Tuberibacillus calidus]|uniref:hypothetical protein n=1 Tax=Tuberibacillus calidus TaxID=340097 RepID=UPI00040DF8E1|nr:hypothetical protein [Tuberibacillus calidus]